MKNIKILTAFVILFFTALPAAQAKDKVITASQLPKTATLFLDQHFTGQKVTLATEDKDWFSVDYEVLLADNTRIEFNQEGEWTEVKNEINGIPSSFLLENITSYISTNFKDVKVEKIEKNRFSYEVKLSNGLELIFSKDGVFSKIDD